MYTKSIPPIRALRPLIYKPKHCFSIPICSKQLLGRPYTLIGRPTQGFAWGIAGCILDFNPWAITIEDLRLSIAVLFHQTFMVEYFQPLTSRTQIQKAFMDHKNWNKQPPSVCILLKFLLGDPTLLRNTPATLNLYFT